MGVDKFEGAFADRPCDDHDRRTLPRKGKGFTGLWFDPRTGMTQALASSIDAWERGSSIPKPTADDWLLLLKNPPEPR